MPCLFLLVLPFRHERAQFPKSQHLSDKHQARKRGDGAEAVWKALPRRPRWQRKGKHPFIPFINI